MRIAAVDCGTNSIRLLILDHDGNRIEELCREVRLARLGQDVDATGEFHPEALKRTFAVFDEFAQLIAEHRAEKLRLVATSATRDVANRELFLAGVRERLGVEADVISGQEEARLSAFGVMSGVGAAAPVLVVDIGGGSTELILLDGATQIRSSVSLNVGAVRLKERFLTSDPATEKEIATARAFVAQLLDSSGIAFDEVETTIGVAGTVTSLAAHVLKLSEYSREVVHRTRLSKEDIARVSDHWLTTPAAEIEQEPCMHPLRASIIGAGALILSEISNRVSGGSVLVSETDILDGVALSLLS